MRRRHPDQVAASNSIQPSRIFHVATVQARKKQMSMNGDCRLGHFPSGNLR